jgi:hypothetical protein
MRAFGRNLQRLGLFLPPVAVMLQLFERIDVRKMLVMLVFSVCSFILGRIVEGYSNR